MNIYTTKTNITKFFLSITAVALSLSLFAEAGTSLFTYGKVQLRTSNGELADLGRGMEINTGDSVLTGINGRAQIRMQDGALFDIRPNSEFLIENYAFNQNENLLTSSVSDNENKGFYRLVRGGFRAVSGLIGKRNKKNYRVRTPVATIGIRGTDYTAILCEQNCGVNGSGLYLSVASGGVVIGNDAGSLDIDVGQAGFAADLGTAPLALASGSIAAASSSSDEDLTLVPKEADDGQGNVISLESGDTQAVVEVVPEPTGIPGRIAASVAGNLQSASGATANLELNESASVNGFSTQDSSYSIDTASNTNQGFDDSTGLYWGRWSNGTATNATASEANSIDLTNSSAHWIYTTNEITPTLPSTGTATFTLAGNTNPTDNFGESGVLGTANMSADFTSQTVDVDVNLAINNQTWDANADDVALNGEAATFSGDFDQVTITTITDQDTRVITEGDGELSGFLTGDENGDVAGAGVVYSLTDNVDTTVEGAIAFEVE